VIGIMGKRQRTLIMPEQNRPLAEYVRETMFRHNLYATDVERESKKGGFAGISNSYVSKIARGDFGDLTPPKITALARGLGVPESEIIKLIPREQPKVVPRERKFSPQPEATSDLSALLLTVIRGLPPLDRQKLQELIDRHAREVGDE
jgi:transcriptional regulator with XRE-family HTH domain